LPRRASETLITDGSEIGEQANDTCGKKWPQSHCGSYDDMANIALTLSDLSLHHNTANEHDVISGFPMKHVPMQMFPNETRRRGNAHQSRIETGFMDPLL
jgi:hypothetical protein